MTVRNELAVTSRRGKLARSVFAGLLLVLSLALAPCFARPPSRLIRHDLKAINRRTSAPGCSGMRT